MKITKTFVISTVDDLTKYVIHSDKVLASEIAGLKFQYAWIAVALGICWISNIRMNNLTDRLEKQLKEESKHNDKDEEM